MSYMCMVGETTKESEKLTTRVCMLQNGEWLMCTLAYFFISNNLLQHTFMKDHSIIHLN